MVKCEHQIMGKMTNKPPCHTAVQDVQEIKEVAQPNCLATSAKGVTVHKNVIQNRI